MEQVRLALSSVAQTSDSLPSARSWQDYLLMYFLRPKFRSTADDRTWPGQTQGSEGGIDPAPNSTMETVVSKDATPVVVLKREGLTTCLPFLPPRQIQIQ